MASKICTKCSKKKELSFFYKNKSTNDGYTSWCKECMNLSNKKYKKNNKKEYYKNYNKNYQNNNKKILQDYQKEYYKLNKERLKDNNRNFYNKNKNIINEKRKDYNKKYSKKHRNNNKEKISYYNKKYYNNNKEKINKYNNEYFKTEKGKIIAINNTNRRRSIYKVTDITSKYLLELKQQTDICELCEIKMVNNGQLKDGKQLDHIIPLNIGGKHIMKNVRYICKSCNLKRPKDGSDLNEI